MNEMSALCLALDVGQVVEHAAWKVPMMEIVYFFLSLIGGFCVMGLASIGVLLMATQGTGKTQRERNLQAGKQAAEHPDASAELGYGQNTQNYKTLSPR
jgi:hypothetical protein